MEKILAEKENHFYISDYQADKGISIKEAIKSPYYGFKWFPPDLLCRGFQYKENVQNRFGGDTSHGRLGFHYHPKPKYGINSDTFISQKWGYDKTYSDLWIIHTPDFGYTKENPQESEIYVVSNMELVRKIGKEEEKEFILEATKELRIQETRRLFNIDRIIDLSSKFPNLIFGGSSALVLYGIPPLERSGVKSDLDVIMPYYDDLTGTYDSVHAERNTFKIEKISDKSSGNDFGFTLGLSGPGGFVKLDVLIDPYTQYKKVLVDGVTVKLALPEVILKYKLKYALNGQEKHLNDIYQMMGIKKKLDDINGNDEIECTDLTLGLL